MKLLKAFDYFLTVLITFNFFLDYEVHDRTFSDFFDDMKRSNRFLVLNLDDLPNVKDGYLMPLSKYDEIPGEYGRISSEKDSERNRERKRQ